jgi:hypothetical protein
MVACFMNVAGKTDHNAQQRHALVGSLTETGRSSVTAASMTATSKLCHSSTFGKTERFYIGRRSATSYLLRSGFS